MIASSKISAVALACLLTFAASAQDGIICPDVPVYKEITGELDPDGAESSLKQAIKAYGPNIVAAAITGIIYGAVEGATEKLWPYSINKNYPRGILKLAHPLMVKISCDTLEQRGIKTDFFFQWLLSGAFSFISYGAAEDIVGLFTKRSSW